MSFISGSDSLKSPALGQNTARRNWGLSAAAGSGTMAGTGMKSGLFGDGDFIGTVSVFR